MIKFIEYLFIFLINKKHFLITKHTKDEGDDLINKKTKLNNNEGIKL